MNGRSPNDAHSIRRASRASAMIIGLAAALAAPGPAAAVRISERPMGPAYVHVRNIPVPCNPGSADVDQRRHAVWGSCGARISETTQRVVTTVPHAGNAA